jgi:hypothetical protein
MQILKRPVTRPSQAWNIMSIAERHGGAALHLIDPSDFLEASNDKMSEVQSLIII